ncbi:hypothetical protein B7494_g6787 [Chlorociboria aeruginascens]|nr:hypothetical protein B7494_g6787 [Chlorociboria aeruginascens]
MSSDLAILDSSNPASPLSVNASHTALLLVDYHNLIVSMCGPAALPAIVKANSMREWAAAKKIPIYHCLIDLEVPISPTFKAADRFKNIVAAVAANPVIAEEHVGIAPKEGEHIVKRIPGYTSALKSVGLIPALEAQGVKSLIISGISTSNCVISTARAGSNSDYIVTVVEDACFDPVEGLQDTLVKNVFPSGAHVVKAEEFQQQWDKAS